MAAMSVKVLLVLVLVAFLSVHVNGSMWTYFIKTNDLDNDGVLKGDEEMAKLKASLMKLGKAENAVQSAMDSADTDWNGEINAEGSVFLSLTSIV
ncbi:hypothetical protein SNE40_006225 [Patella caerulea]|uniref:EF-hand domain-containing protein n=1 Tax=Patella caerulea TaxID=87958 RepID=A0AAN8K109_PATCE